MYLRAASPIGVLAFIASRMIAPVEMCLCLVLSANIRACVPLPAPGGPKNAMRIVKLRSLDLFRRRFRREAGERIPESIRKPRAYAQGRFLVSRTPCALL